MVDASLDTAARQRGDPSCFRGCSDMWIRVYVLCTHFVHT
jgi:hypothetical protein